MAGVLYTRQRVYNEKPTFNPDEFKRMIEEAEPTLKGLFNQLYAGTNPRAKSTMTNEKNKKKTGFVMLLLLGGA